MTVSWYSFPLSVLPGLPRESDTISPAAPGSPGRENSRLRLSAYCHCIVFSICYPSLVTVFLDGSLNNDGFLRAVMHHRNTPDPDKVQSPEFSLQHLSPQFKFNNVVWDHYGDSQENYVIQISKYSLLSRFQKVFRKESEIEKTKIAKITYAAKLYFLFLIEKICDLQTYSVITVHYMFSQTRFL